MDPLDGQSDLAWEQMTLAAEFAVSGVEGVLAGADEVAAVSAQHDLSNSCDGQCRLIIHEP
jgi:hypothetical protein